MYIQRVRNKKLVKSLLYQPSLAYSAVANENHLPCFGMRNSPNFLFFRAA